MRITGTIRKWTGKGWGLANSYPDRRWFVHVSQAVNEETQLALGLGVRISFEEGAPRSAVDLPAALNIELAPIPVKQAQSVEKADASAPVDPSLASGEKGGAA
jgi:hypothetical protein